MGRGSSGINGGGSGGGSPSQKQLAADASKIDAMWNMTPNERFWLADKYTKDVANENNFFENSVGFWDLRKSRPKGQPNHVSYNRRTGKKSSEYWYTKDGVIRGSDHWGSDVASCSWYIKGRKYKNDGVSVGSKEYAFISWKDLKAKGMISKHYQTGKYSLIGFKFEK